MPCIITEAGLHNAVRDLRNSEKVIIGCYLFRSTLVLVNNSLFNKLRALRDVRWRIPDNPSLAPWPCRAMARVEVVSRQPLSLQSKLSTVTQREC